MHPDVTALAGVSGEVKVLGSNWIQEGESPSQPEMERSVVSKVCFGNLIPFHVNAFNINVTRTRFSGGKRM